MDYDPQLEGQTQSEGDVFTETGEHMTKCSRENNELPGGARDAFLKMKSELALERESYEKLTKY